MARLTREVWFEAGRRVLREEGAAGLTIERLTQELEVTKGSFYHHFKNRDDYSQGLLTHWEKTLTQEFIESSRHEEGFSGRIERLNRLSQAAFDPQLELAIRAWALREPAVMAFQERVDRQRLAYLTELFQMITGTGQLASDLALIRYAFSVGAQQLRPALEPGHYSRLFGLLQRQLVETADLKPNPDGGTL